MKAARVLAGLLVLLAACATPRDEAPRETLELELVESSPIETTLDHAELRDAHVVWLEMVERARTSLDLAQFYVSDHAQSRLTPIIAALERAAGRGVRVRFLADARFAETYPDVLARLDAHAGIEVRHLDLSPAGGSILHAKYFVADGVETWIGSHNFDWRSLEHIQELGVRVRSRELARAVLDVFERDWAFAAAEDAPDETARAPQVPVPTITLGAGAHAQTVRPVFSPRTLLPDPESWDLPQLVALIDGAREHVRVQLLTYKSTARGGERFADLDDALRRAAARGVTVELLLADWGKRKGTIEGLQDLARVPGLAIKLVTIPQWSGGFVPYARVIHAKYLVVDGARAWIGTSNWERDYFHASRNVGVIVEDTDFAGRLERYFADGWNSTYAAPVDPHAVYTAPRIGE